MVKRGRSRTNRRWQTTSRGRARQWILFRTYHSVWQKQHARFPRRDFWPSTGRHNVQNQAEALELANDTDYGLGAGVWTRNGTVAYQMGRGIQAGRVWTNCYHAYPAHAAFGGYKQSGIGRETHKMMLEHYQQTKCLLVSYSEKPQGFF